MTPLRELALIAFPVRELFMLKIKEFDLIILDRFQNRGTLPPLYLQNIADYVRDGGALLMSVGPEFTGDVQPRLRPARRGAAGDPAGKRRRDRGRVPPGGDRRSACATRSPPSCPACRRHRCTPTGGAGTAASTPIAKHGEDLMSGPDGRRCCCWTVSATRRAAGASPCCCPIRSGCGRAAIDGGGPQAELLRRIAHWLMKEPELEENRADRPRRGWQALGRAPHHRRRRAGQVTVTAPDGTQTRLPLKAIRPGRAEAAMAARAPGVWQASDGKLTAYAAAGATNPLEIADLRATATVLAPLVRASGGSIHWLDPDGAPELRRTEPGHDAAGGGWIGLQRRHDHLVTGIAALPLLPAWAALVLLLGLAVAAWRREAS